MPVSVKQTTPGKFRCEYVPREPGLHTVNILFAGRPISDSPYGVNVSACKSNFRTRKNTFCHWKLNSFVDFPVFTRSLSYDLRERLATIEEDYQSTVELEQPKYTTSARYLKGLLDVCRKGFGEVFISLKHW